MTDKIEKLEVSEIPDLRTDTAQDTVDSVPEPVKPKKLNIFQKSANWWNGKKTIIGAAGSLIGIGLTKIADPTFQVIGWTLQGICYPLTVIGIGHKFNKAKGSDNVFGPAGEFKIDNKTIVEIIPMIWKRIKEICILCKALYEAAKIFLKL